MRTSRSNGSTTYTYVYNGSQLVQMTKGSDTLYFTYGAIGPTTVTWNGTTYYYAVNPQGDVVGIFDGSGNCVVTYNWDNAWGYNPEPEGSMANTLGTLNPLRYRSYVYDEETGLYYLQSRYYNPEVCRFINADAYASTGQGLLGNNMFAYCLNNPVNRIDITGTASIWWYLKGDHDWGFIHREVVRDIEKRYKVKTEVALSEYGRADIMRGSAVWEVKHAGKNPLQRMVIAFAEACGYVALNRELDTVGAPYAFSGTIYIGCEGASYRVDYTTPFFGAVLYTVTEQQNYNGEYAAAYVPKSKRSEHTSPSMAGGLALGGIAAGIGCGFGGGFFFGFGRQEYSFF